MHPFQNNERLPGVDHEEHVAISTARDKEQVEGYCLRQELRVPFVDFFVDVRCWWRCVVLSQ